MDRRMAGILIAVLMCLPAVFPAVVASPAVSRVTVTPDGRYWSDDKRLTNHPSDDYLPQIWSDKDGITHIVWVRDGIYMALNLDEQGRIIASEREIASAWLPRHTSGQAVNSIDMDSKGNFSMIRWEGGAYNGQLIYDKYDMRGVQLVATAYPTSGLQISGGPNLGVGSGDNAIISYDYWPGGGLGRVGATFIDAKGLIIKSTIEVTNSSVYVEGSTFTMDQQGNMRVLGNVWQGAAQGIWAYSLDKFGVRPADTPPMYVYPTGSYSFPPMPAMAACPDGSVGLLVPSPGQPGKLAFIRLDAKNVPVAGKDLDIVLTNNAADYGDLACDANNVFYAVWPNATNGHLYYNVIHPGLEYSPIPAMELTKQGTARAPKLAIDQVGGIHVVWREERDGNPEIYHKWGFGVGVELSLAPEEIAKLMFIHPAEIKSANLTIKNLGGLNDTFELNVTIEGDSHNNSGLEVWLDDYTIDLDALVTNKLRVYVKGPTDCSDAVLNVTIRATSARDPTVNSSVTFRIFPICCACITITFPDNVHLSLPGEPTQYGGVLKNQGDLTEDIVVELEGPVDWKFTLAASQFTLKPRATAQVFVTVTPPSDAMGDEIGQVTVKAYIADKPQICDLSVIHTVVSPMMLIGLSIPEPLRYIDPGNTTEFEVEISNNGNMPGIAIIVLEIVSGVGDFTAYWDRNSVGLEARAKGTVTLTVVSPADARAGTRLVIRVIAFNEYKTQSAEGTVTVIINQVHRLDVSASPATATVDPGGSVAYQVQVRNNGNGDELLTPGTAALPAGWKLEYGSGGGGVNAVLLAPGASATLAMEVRATLEALEGPYDVAGMVMNEKGMNWTFPVKTIVRQVYAVELTVAQSKRHGTPGGWALFECKVKNLGNGLDMVSLNVSGLPAGWKSQFTLVNAAQDKVALEAVSSVSVSLVVTIPQDASSSVVDFLVSAVSSVGVRDTSTLAITVGLANLVLANATFNPPTSVINKAMTIELLVRNIGEADCNNVTVVFYDEGRQVASKDIVVFPAGTTKSVVFEWVPARTGEHKLKFVVDPDGKIAESDKMDNILMDKVTVKSSSGSTPGFEGELLISAIIFMAIIVIVQRRR